jgi:hypothetical protein
MKLFFLFFSCCFSFYSQELVQIGMGPSYQYDIYYSFENGITAYPERENWELAFSTDLYEGNIRINSGAQVSLYEVAQNTKYWMQITNIPSDALQLRNSNQDWSIGAFLSNSSGDLNYGWGSYNTENGFIEGEKIYIIDSFEGQKKIQINNFYMGVFNFTIANLDGSNYETITIDASLYQDKKFIYFSLNNNEIIDREPEKDNWDLLFTTYEEEDVILNSDTMPYIVTGVLSNENLTYQFEGPVNQNPEISLLNFNYDINTIGYDWKEYNDSFIMVPDRSYFIFNLDETILYKMVFESFSGQSSGNLSFFLEDIEYSPASFIEEDQIKLNIFPNPNNGNFNLELNGMDFFVSCFDLNGKKIISKECSDFCNFDLSNVSKGIYLLKLESEKMNLIKKIIIDK